MPEDTSWLTKFVLAAASLPHKDTGDRKSLTSPNGKTYFLGDLIRQTSQLRMYEGWTSEDRSIVVSVVTDKDNNDMLLREASIIAELREADPLNYSYFFPDIIETFIDRRQGGRRINVVGFSDALTTYHNWSPLAKAVPEGYVIGARSSIWILGKLLKVIGYAHSNSVVNHLVNSPNILIEENEHGVLLLGWIKAKHYDQADSLIFEAGQEVKQAVAIVIGLLGGDPKTGSLPNDVRELKSSERDSFVDFFNKVYEEDEPDAWDIHHRWYALADSLWPRQRVPFQTYAS